jgi:transcriptional regulator with XRE-family HTH domain
MSKLRNVSGAAVRRYRDKKGLSQTGLALKCQLIGWDASRDVIAAIEDGSRVVKDLELVILAKVLGVPTGDFLPKRVNDDLRAILVSSNEG